MVALDDGDRAYLGDKHFYKDRAVSQKYFDEGILPCSKSDREVAGFALTPLSDAPVRPGHHLRLLPPGPAAQPLMAAKYEAGYVTEASLDTCASCVHTVIPVLNGEKAYNVSIPDPGEYERGLCDEDEMIFTLRADRLSELMSGLTMMDRNGFGYRQLSMDMHLDYARPSFITICSRSGGCLAASSGVYAGDRRQFNKDIDIYRKSWYKYIGEKFTLCS